LNILKDVEIAKSRGVLLARKRPLVETQTQKETIHKHPGLQPRRRRMRRRRKKSCCLTKACLETTNLRPFNELSGGRCHYILALEPR
jgi:hypothetical protein